MEGMTLEKLQVIIEAYTKPYRDELDKVRKQTSAVTAQIERQTAQIRNSYRKVGNVIASVLSIGAIVAFGKSCVDLGSDLQEVQNVVDVTFGAMSGRVDAFAKNSIEQFGLSELAAKQYMGTYGAMAKSFGITGEAGYQLSASIAGLTGDLASFRNLSNDEAFTKLKSIFTGETESLKELGVVMTQTALDQYALNEGLGKTTVNMTEQEKVLLRYRFVMSALSDASGDFARTSGSWANQVRVLQLQFESLKATIGQGLINAFTPVIQVINTILAKMQTLAAYFKAFTVALFGDAGGSSDIASSMASAAGSSGTVADNMGAAASAAKDMKNSLAAFDEINNLTSNSSSGGSGGGGSSGTAIDFGNLNGELFSEVEVNPEVEEAVTRLKEILEALREAAAPTTTALKQLWNEGLAKLGSFTWTALEDFWDYFLKPLGNWVLGEGLPEFLDVTNDLLNDIDWDKLNNHLRRFWQELEPFSEHIGEGLLWFYQDVLVPIGKWTANYVLPEFFEEFADVLDGVNYYLDKVKPLFKELSTLLDDINEKIENSTFNQGIEKVNDFLERLGIKIEIPSLEEFFSDRAVENALRSVEAFNTIMTFADAMQTLEGLETWWNKYVSPYLDIELWREAWSVIKPTLKEAWDDAVDQWKQEVSDWWNNEVLDRFSAEKWSSGLSGIKTGFTTAFDAAFEGVKGLWNNFAGWLNEKLNFDIDPIEIAGKQIFGGASISLGRIPTFATGGFPSQGQMFVARESGPEMVGRIGNRTAVANNDQIVDAISKGVYMAMISSGGTNEDALYRALKRALQETDFTAVMDTDKAFKAMQKKAEDYRKRTGKPAFGY